MKKIAALGLAGLVGASALAMTAGSASAMPPGPPPWNHHYYPHNNGYWNHNWHRGPGWGWGGPFLFGLGVGTLYGNAYDDRYGGDDHVRWCASHYRTYSPQSDTFFIRPGVPARCIAPFDR